MSKLSPDTLRECVQQLIAASKEKKRGFTETIELQIALKNYDPVKDKRFSGSILLPIAPRDKYKVCVIGNDKHIGEAKEGGFDAMSVEDLKKLKKGKKQVKKLANGYNSFLASSTLIRQIPRLLGPGLNKAGKFPAVLGPNDDIGEKVRQAKASVKFQLKSKKTLCMGVPIANIAMSEDDIVANITLAVNFLVSLLPKTWQQVKRLHIKSSMGPAFRVYGF
jgi:large subunit ribosomal protein L10Ae